MSNYIYTHADIAAHTSLSSQRVGKLAVKLSGLLNAYRESGINNKYLYDSSGLKVWEEIARLSKNGLGPQSIEGKLRKLFGKQIEERKQSSDAGQEPGTRGGEELTHVPMKIFDDMREDLKSVIVARDAEVNRLLRDLDEYKKQLPAPDEWRRRNQEASEARAEAARLLRELDSLENKGYWWIRKSERRRKEEIINKLSDLNFKH